MTRKTEKETAKKPQEIMEKEIGERNETTGEN